METQQFCYFKRTQPQGRQAESHQLHGRRKEDKRKETLLSKLSSWSDKQPHGEEGDFRGKKA